MIEELPNLNTGTPWSEWDDADIKWHVKHKIQVDEIADFLCRTEAEVRSRARELKLGELPVVKARRKRKLIRGSRTPISER